MDANRDATELLLLRARDAVEPGGLRVAAGDGQAGGRRYARAGDGCESGDVHIIRKRAG